MGYIELIDGSGTKQNILRFRNNCTRREHYRNFFYILCCMVEVFWHSGDLSYTICWWRIFTLIILIDFTSHREKISIKITVLLQYLCSMFIVLHILYCRIVKNTCKVFIIKFYCGAPCFFTGRSVLMKNRSEIVTV